MKIDRMTENQLEAVAQLEQRCFSHPWSFNSLEEELNNETSLFFTATEDNAVVGYIGMSVVVDEGYIFNVAVDGTHRNRGIGSALVETLVTYAKKITFAFSLLRFVKVTGMPVLSMKNSDLSRWERGKITTPLQPKTLF